MEEKKDSFFTWFEKKFFGLMEECKNEYEDFEKKIEYANRKYQYECPECGKINRFESEVTMIRCDKCDHVFDPRVERIMKNTIDMAKCNDWKILDVNCLGEIIKEKCEVQINTTGWSESRSYADRDFNLIIKYLLEGVEYRYRPTPTKKSHEELAEEYTNGLHKHAFSYPVRSYNHLVNMIFDNVQRSFIAGRKSMESEK